MSLRDRFLKEVATLGLPEGPEGDAPGAGKRSARLPEAVRRYLRYMGVAERTPDWSFRLSFTGWFRTKPEQRWMPCEAWQYSSGVAVARIFHIRVRMGGLLPVVARDTYREGRGRMLIRLADLVTIGDGRGDEYDTSELVTYLNDGVMLAPSMLLGLGVSWTEVDEGSFDVALTDHGRTVRARVFLDEQGAPIDFHTTDRFLPDPADPKKLMRAKWTTPMAGWERMGDRPLPTGGQAVWHLSSGPFVYADFRLAPATVAFNVQPGE